MSYNESEEVQGALNIRCSVKDTTVAWYFDLQCSFGELFKKQSTVIASTMRRSRTLGASNLLYNIGVKKRTNSAADTSLDALRAYLDEDGFHMQQLDYGLSLGLASDAGDALTVMKLVLDLPKARPRPAQMSNFMIVACCSFLQPIGDTGITMSFNCHYPLRGPVDMQWLHPQHGGAPALGGPAVRLHRYVAARYESERRVVLDVDVDTRTFSLLHPFARVRTELTNLELGVLVELRMITALKRRTFERTLQPCDGPDLLRDEEDVQNVAMSVPPGAGSDSHRLQFSLTFDPRLTIAVTTQGRVGYVAMTHGARLVRGQHQDVWFTVALTVTRHLTPPSAEAVRAAVEAALGGWSLERLRGEIKRREVLDAVANELQSHRKQKYYLTEIVLQQAARYVTERLAEAAADEED